MVVGINKFKEYFKGFPDSYIAIGGTACDIIIEDAGFVPRATNDIDIILIVEALTPAFIKRFLEFINDGKYNSRQKDLKSRKSYRFRDPQSPDFPKQIELFSKNREDIELYPEAHLTPIPAEEGISSLSAILLNDDYYKYALLHSEYKDDIRYAKIEALICLKAFAYLDNKRLKEEGKPITTGNVIKHRNDVFRLVFLLKPDEIFELPASIKKDLQHFVDVVKNDLPGPSIFDRNGFGRQDMNVIYQQLVKSFNLDMNE
jgi:hypothetical protein